MTNNEDSSKEQKFHTKRTTQKILFRIGKTFLYQPSPVSLVKQCSPRKVHAQFLDKFESFLKGPESNIREGIPQIVSGLRTLFMGTNALSISSLFRLNIVREKYLMDYYESQKSHAPKSIQKYLT